MKQNSHIIKMIGVFAVISISALMFQNCASDLQSDYSDSLTSKSLNEPFNPDEFSGDDIPNIPLPPELPNVGDMPPTSPYQPPISSPNLQQKVTTLFQQHVLPHGDGLTVPNHQVGFWTHQVENNNLTDVQLEAGIKIVGFYVKHLKRMSDLEGLKYWLKEHIENGESLLNIENHIANSVESKIVKLYMSKDNRTPDAEGRLYWVDAISNNKSTLNDLQYLLDNRHLVMRSILKDQSISKNDFDMFGKTAGIINSMFSQHSDLTASYTQVAYWQYQLNQGVSINSVKVGIQVEGYYAKYLNRRADLEGIHHWFTQILNGNLSLSQVEEVIKNSKEAKIVQAYQAYDNRSPDPEGRVYWRDMLTKNPNAINDMIHILQNPQIIY